MARPKNVRKAQGGSISMIFLFMADVRHFAKTRHFLNAVVCGYSVVLEHPRSNEANCCAQGRVCSAGPCPSRG
jgi:hypothetical protein